MVKKERKMAKKMECENCGTKSDKEWNFCPKCGTEIGKKSFIDYGLADVVTRFADNLTKKLLFEGMRMQDPKNAGSFTVKIMKGGATPINSNINAPDAKAADDVRKKISVPAKLRPAPKEIVEPKATFNKLPGKLVVEVDAPGVNSVEDVDVLEMGTSVEVRAYTGDKLYFKIISVPKHSSVIAKKVEDEKVILEMSG